MTSAAQTPAKRFTLRSVALPSEHGGWGFLLEPILLGLLLVPTWAGLLIGIATTCIFLLRHPLRIIVTDWKRGRRYVRTRAAERFALGYAVLATAAFVLAIWLAGTNVLQPLLVAIPFAAVMIGFDLRGESRQWLPELAGPVALASSAAMITLAGGWALLPSLGLIVLLSARSIPAVLYVRSRLRLAKNQPVNANYAKLAHAASILIGIGFFLSGAWPIFTTVAYAALFLRALVGLLPDQQNVPAKVIGFQELGYGLLLVSLSAIGFHLGL